MLDGLDQVWRLQAALAADGLPVVETGHRVVGTETCHFSAPSSMPDDAAQPSGRLIFTGARAIFAGGAKALTLPWHTVAEVAQQERDVILVRHDRETFHRFRCNVFADALCAGLLARTLARRTRSGRAGELALARGRALQSPVCLHPRLSPAGLVTPGIERLLTVDRASRRRPPRRARLQPGVGRRRAGAYGRQAARGSGRHPGRAFRASARLPVGPAGQHDRNAPRRGSRGGVCPIFSLYSDTREPTPDMLEGLDVLVIDLQDVGTRVYTYIYTMANCMRAAARRGLPVVVCDRPNPIGGDDVEGACLDQTWSSFVGQFPIPMRHGMTIGELARLFNDAFGIGARLEVVALDGWQRSMYFDETGLPWIIPSPNLPTLDSAIVYPGAVLIEGTKLSEGRGTTRPFELIGAPWIDGERLAAAMNARGLAGRALPAGVLRADVPEACPPVVRRLPDSRSRPPGFSTLTRCRRAHRRVPPRGSRTVRLERAAVRVRARQGADRYPVRLGSPAPDLERQRERGRPRRVVAP